MTTLEIFAAVLNRRQDFVNAGYAAAAHVIKDLDAFAQLFYIAAYAPLDWLQYPEPLNIPQKVGTCAQGALYQPEDGDAMPAPYAEIPNDFAAALRHLATSPTRYFVATITFDKVTARIEFSNGDYILFRNIDARPAWLPDATRINPRSLNLIK